MRRFLVLCLLGLAAPAQASEVFGGLLAHDVNTPLTQGGLEDGADVQLGWRGDRLRFLGGPSPYAFVSVATGGETHMAAAGLGWGGGGGGLYPPPRPGRVLH